MAITWTFAADFFEAMAEKKLDLASDTIKVALSNTAPASESSNPLSTGNGILANVTEISYGNYADDLGTDRVLEGVSSDESGGTYTFDANDFTISASGGDLAAFRYLYIFDDTGTTPDDPLIGVFDLGQVITILDGNSHQITFNASGIFTMAQV